MTANSIPHRFSLGARLKSFGYAFAGLGFMLRTQHNAWVHLAASVMVVGLGAALRVSLGDWRWLIAAIFMVWAAEAFSTAVEYVCDMVSPERNIVVKHAKDIAAGAVLLSAVSALLIGVITFYPYVRVPLLPAATPSSH
jgi:diacylglycerol kinase (ATP)